VATFCTKCGAAASPDKQFCTACGAPLPAGTGWQAGPDAPPPPVQPAALPYGQPVVTPHGQPAVGQPIVASSPSGGGALKVVLIIVAVFVGLGILGSVIFGFAMWRLAHAVHVEGNGDKVTLNLPGASISANQGNSYSASELGTDVYPGAQNGHGSTRMDFPTGSMVTGIFLTSDSKDRVLDFYKGKLGSAATVVDTGDSAILTLAKDEQESVMVTISAKSSQNDGKTQIAIVHTKTKKSS